MTDYLKKPDDIYAKSFATILAEADLSLIPKSAHAIAIRIIHACGMVDIARDIIISPDFAISAKAALASNARIFVDAEMVRHGIATRLLPDRDRIICTLNDPLAKQNGVDRSTTRSAAAVELWRPHLGGNVVVIGNAPTALFALLDMLDTGAPKPAAIIAFPVGFVGAAESKDQLIANSRGIPFATLRGRKGGSAMAASVVNALLDELA